MSVTDLVIQPDVRLLDGSSMTRSTLVKPGMCGHNSLFVGQIGDWTWETVSALCGVNAFAATNDNGLPTYLSFYYFHIKASPVMHLGKLTFGDQIRVTSRLFDFGSESILALHKIKLEDRDAAPIDPHEFYAQTDERCIYVENLNRWITRADGRSNDLLLKSSPVGFEHAHLPALPDEYSPRRAYQYARSHLTFLDRDHGRLPTTEPFTVDYHVDITRDLNGVGLLYFAAYFSIVDAALLGHWRRLGRSDESFLDRVVLDHRICYLGNVNAGSVLRNRVAGWRTPGRPDDEVVEIVLEDRGTGRVIAVSTVQYLIAARRGR